jgi:hypothetical protein
MAPVAPLGRKAAMDLVARGRIPLSFGSPHPTVAIVEQDGKLRIRELVVDDAEARAAGEAARAKGEPWMPESYYALGKPTGRIHAEASTREELLETMRTMEWPADW